MESQQPQSEAADGMSKSKIKSRKAKRIFIPRIGCLRVEDVAPSPPRHDGGGFSMEMESDGNGQPCLPSHLVVMVNGIIGSADDWKFGAKQFLFRYPRDIVVHCSKSNYSMLTLDGVDVMGERLAQEVLSVVSRKPNLRKISFVAHSLGGLIARYAIARLYTENNSNGLIAGLEPINFVTFATPHLGSRGHKQVPGFGSLRFLEKFARLASWMLSRTGRHLFLTDKDNGKPPLLLRMVTDSEDLRFVSALRSFQRRVAYANARFDYAVGWTTSSIRRKQELPKLQRVSKDVKYPHIVNVEAPAIVDFEGEVVLEDNMKKLKTVEMEELMIKGLTRVSWERVDVSFRGSRQRFLAHIAIQVKTYCINSDGADVISHLIDNFLL